ncbi:MAG: M1 family metallopeptidase, partial [bacterium]
MTNTIEFVQPDDGNNDDQTVMKVTLPRYIPPRGTIKLLLAFKSKLPRAFARTGYKGNYFFVAQWFPKIGVFENGKWSCHQFHMLTEFFADYGIYDVNITVPADFIVGATGARRNKSENEDGSVTYNYYQESVHDFAWTASPHYVEIQDKFASPPLREVNLTLLIQPQHLHMVERYLEATKHTLKYYGQWYGEYPYSHLTIVDPAFNSRTGGMEYPTLFTGGTNWLSPKAILSPESVTIHECGHQFWYGLVGNNEFENAWMDEGFNSYAQAKVINKVYGIRPYERRYFGFPVVFDEVKIDPVMRRMPAYLEAVKSDEMARESYTYVDRASLRANAYSKPALMLSTLENYLGEETFGKIMNTYSLRWRYKHPKPQDFIDVVNEVTGKDMNWFFDEFLYSSNVLDYAVGKISSRPKMKKRGFFDKDGEKVFFSGKENEEKEKETIYETEVLIQRLGEARIPVEILITFANGDSVRKEWDGQYRWVKYTFEKPTQLKSVQVDPDHKLVLDV